MINQTANILSIFLDFKITDTNSLWKGAPGSLPWPCTHGDRHAPAIFWMQADISFIRGKQSWYCLIVRMVMISPQTCTHHPIVESKTNEDKLCTRACMNCGLLFLLIIPISSHKISECCYGRLIFLNKQHSDTANSEEEVKVMHMKHESELEGPA